MALKTVKTEPGAPPPADSAAAAKPEAPVAAPAAAKTGTRRKVLLGIAAVLVVGGLWMGTDWFLNGRFDISTDNAFIRSDITRVTPKVQGYVTAIHVVDNQPVKAGDLLISLEAADFEARVAQAKADLAQAEANAAQANARISAQRDQVAEANAAREAADANADMSASDAKRFAELADKGWYPKAKAEQAEAAKRTANAQLTQAQATITAQRSQLTSAQAAAQSANAAVEAAKAKLAAAQLDLSRTEIRAPIDGVVANKVVAEGQLLSPNQAALAIVPATGAYLIANFKETQIAAMKPGQRVTIHVDAYPDRKVTGKVESIAPNTGATFSLVPQDTATGNFTKIVQRVPVRITIDPESLKEGPLQSGLQVVATISTKPDDK